MVDLKELIKNCIVVVKEMDVTFQLKDKDLSYEEVFSIDGLLPAIAKRADQLSSLCFGYGLGFSFTETEKSILGFTLQADDSNSLFVRLLCIVDIVKEICKGSAGNKISMDELLYD